MSEERRNKQITRWIIWQVNSSLALRLTATQYRETHDANVATLFETEQDATDAYVEFLAWLAEKKRLRPIYNGEPWSSWDGGVNTIEVITFTVDRP